MARDVHAGRGTPARGCTSATSPPPGTVEVIRWAKAPGHRRDRRGHPAPPAADHRPARRLRPDLQGQPAAAPARGRRGAARRRWPTAPSTPSPPTTPRTPGTTRSTRSSTRRSACSGWRPRWPWCSDDDGRRRACSTGPASPGVMSAAPAPDRRAGRPRPAARGRRAGQPHAGRPGGRGSPSTAAPRCPCRATTPGTAAPCAVPCTPRSCVAAPTVLKGALRMTRVRAVGVVLVALGVIYALLYAAWLRSRAPARVRGGRRRAQPHEPAPRGARRHPEEPPPQAATPRATYVSTTTAGDRLERVTVDGLGVRASAPPWRSTAAASPARALSGRAQPTCIVAAGAAARRRAASGAWPASSSARPPGRRDLARRGRRRLDTGFLPRYQADVDGRAALGGTPGAARARRPHAAPASSRPTHLEERSAREQPRPAEQRRLVDASPPSSSSRTAAPSAASPTAPSARPSARRCSPPA